MARLPRIDVPGLPQHLIIRGNNRKPLFREDADRRLFLHILRDALGLRDCALHAYVLMTNHVHLLATPPIEGALAAAMQSVGRRFSRLMNKRWDRTGTLFEGRFKSSLVDSDTYLLTCMRYIELNPVRAGLVEQPATYPWSSHTENASGCPSVPLVAHDVYLELGRTPEARAGAYVELFERALSEDDLARIRVSARTGRALGTSAFCEQWSVRLNRAVAPRGPGRPARGTAPRGQASLLDS